MPIDINLLRPEKGGNPEIVYESETKRFRTSNAVDTTVALDKDWRKMLFNLENSRKMMHFYQKRVTGLHKSGAAKQASISPPSEAGADLLAKFEAAVSSDEGCAQLLPEVDSLNFSQLTNLLAFLKKHIAKLEAAVKDVTPLREKALAKIGNIVHSSVVVSDDEANNRVVRTWRIPKNFGSSSETREIAESSHGSPSILPPSLVNFSVGFKCNILHHHQILAKLGGFDLKKGVEVAGHRGYFLKGCGVLLNMALVQYGLNFLARKGYTPIQPPFFMRKEIMQETAELKDFEETLYNIPSTSQCNSAAPVSGGTSSSVKPQPPVTDKDDLFLIATSEQPLCALHRRESIEEKNLPIRYAGTSTCFRREAGSHGQDTWGVFRVHQFEKVEQFCITSPEKSWEMHEEMIAIAEEFYQSLDIPYRIVSIVSGALNDAAAKKYDLEAWFPGYNDFKELVSCSNCTDYQSRELDIHLGYKSQSNMTRGFVHLLNATLVASERCMCCILENYQTEEGVIVPRVLVPYVGMEFMRYME
ncbi:putative seryl-tRna synthetase, cytoplasmic [Cardiosporidium cionae]|uniref:serine--tRNA ligase n=1 Tax=Cardiosporidium cionae TaxID=476202 RepID=A0ABQ7J4Z3_9APIC|nr:putative seryl-tRna synthetase, cytoplasmic [Cardiosporidium cionae]|eukprot:KAF8819057.1 putative seryl-tRna synthetase, cytoplasmic [Cardiosporidium cionae]